MPINNPMVRESDDLVKKVLMCAVFFLVEIIQS